MPTPTRDQVLGHTLDCRYNNADGSPNLGRFFQDAFKDPTGTLASLGDCWWTSLHDPLYVGLAPLALVGAPYRDGRDATVHELATWLFWNGVDPGIIGLKLVPDPVLLNKDRKKWVAPKGAPTSGLPLVYWAERELQADIDDDGVIGDPTDDPCEAVRALRARRVPVPAALQAACNRAQEQAAANPRQPRRPTRQAPAAPSASPPPVATTADPVDASAEVADASTDVDVEADPVDGTVAPIGDAAPLLLAGAVVVGAVGLAITAALLLLWRTP